MIGADIYTLTASKHMKKLLFSLDIRGNLMGCNIIIKWL